MPSTASSPDVLVIGGGIVGLAVAWRASERGLSVALLERNATGQGASQVAAGMLAPVSEVEFGNGGRRLLALGLRSAAMWPTFAAQLEAVAGMSVGLRQTGILSVARDDDEAHELERQIALRDSLGLRCRRLRPSQARELEPALAPTIRLALELPDDHSVDPRLVLAALRRACLSSGIEVREHVRATRLLLDGGAVAGVELADGELVRSAGVLIATGAWTGELGGIPAGAGVPVRPVKGQTLRLRDPMGPGLLERVVRFEGGYLVPRADGSYVLGGTVEERDFDDSPTAGAAYELLRDAHDLVPGVSELRIEELCVGLRPGTPDNVPAIGPSAVAGLTWATGHYRNGILLAPLTAELVAAMLAGEPTSDTLLSACAPERFARAEHPAGSEHPAGLERGLADGPAQVVSITGRAS
jgi:glycine oxidase